MAHRLADDGYDLVLGYARDDEAAEVTRAEVLERGVDCLIVRADVTTDEGIDELFDAAIAWKGELGAVINNAGATMHIASLVDTPPEIVRRSVELNLISAILVARRALQLLPEGGVIVNMSSAAATGGSARTYVHYAASKGGLDTLTKGLAVEALDRGVRVVGIAPGAIETRIHEDAGDASRLDRIAQVHPMGRVGQPEEVAGIVAFVLSPEASYIAGTTIRVAGGV